MNFRKGFSLIELSLILVIMAIIAVSFLGEKSDPKNVAAQNKIATSNSMFDLNRELQEYSETFSKYPCPANGELVYGDADFGRGTRDGGGFCTSQNFTSDDGTVLIGVLPIRNLSIPEKNMYDKWGNKIMYAVSKDATETGSGSDVKILHDYEDRETAATPEDMETFVAFSSSPFVLISYGADGVGAYPNGGGANRIQPVSLSGSDVNDSDIQNANHHLRGGSFDSVFVKPHVRFNKAKMKTSPAAGDEIAFLAFDDVVNYVGTANAGGALCTGSEILIGETCVDTTCQAGEYFILDGTGGGVCVVLPSGDSSSCTGGQVWDADTSSCKGLAVTTVIRSGTTCQPGENLEGQYYPSRHCPGGKCGGQQGTSCTVTGGWLSSPPASCTYVTAGGSPRTSCSFSNATCTPTTITQVKCSGIHTM